MVKHGREHATNTFQFNSVPKHTGEEFPLQMIHASFQMAASCSSESDKKTHEVFILQGLTAWKSRFMYAWLRMDPVGYQHS